MKNAVSVLILLLTVGPARADTLYVRPHADYTNEIKAGRLKGSIQDAIDAASDGDTIVVQEGTYLENVNFRGKNIVLTGTNPDDPSVVAATVIDGNTLDSVVTFDGTENETAVLSGFTIQYGYQDYDTIKGGGGICGGSETNHTHATIRNNVITRNFAWDGGGLARCDGLIEKNVITSNTARWYEGGGGLYMCNGAIRNNIISFNNAGGCESAGALSYCDADIESNTIAHNFGNGIGVIAYGAGTIRNCIIWGNLPRQIQNTVPSFSCLEGWTGGGIGNTDADPCFADPNNGDFHLKSQAGRWDPNEQQWATDELTSPCIDAGDPMTPIMLEPFPNGGIINMGAYGGTAEASKSYFGKPPCEIIVAGDINGDCAVNFLDFRLMALHWLANNNL